MPLGPVLIAAGPIAVELTRVMVNSIIEVELWVISWAGMP